MVHSAKVRLTVTIGRPTVGTLVKCTWGRAVIHVEERFDACTIPYKFTQRSHPPTLYPLLLVISYSRRFPTLGERYRSVHGEISLLTSRACPSFIMGVVLDAQKFLGRLDYSQSDLLYGTGRTAAQTNSLMNPTHGPVSDDKIDGKTRLLWALHIIMFSNSTGNVGSYLRYRVSYR